MQNDRVIIDEIKDKIDIVDLIGETITLKHESGDTYKGAIDGSSKSGKSLNVNRRDQVWKDWANDGNKGDAMNWIAYRENLDIQTDFPQILKIAADYAGVKINDSYQSTDNKELLTLNTAIALFYHSQLTDEIRNHITEKWGITNKTIDDIKIGFAPMEDSLLNETEGAFEPDLLKSSGLMIDTGFGVKDFFKGRIVFPYWKGKHVVYFIGRKCEHTPDTKYEQAKYKKQIVHSDKKKYVSEAVNNSYFYGENSLNGAKHCLITEGVTDCIMAMQNGIPCISPVTVRFRKEDNEKMYSLVKRLDTVYICNDSEDNESGMKGAVDTAKFLESKDIDVRLVRLPRDGGVEKVDVADFLRDATKHDFERLMMDESFYVWDLLLENVSVPTATTARMRLCKTFLETSLSGMNDDMFTTFALNDVAEKFQIGKRDVGRLLKSINRCIDIEDETEIDMNFFDETGRLQVKKLSEYVMSVVYLKTMRDNKNVYNYADGVYVPHGEDVITKIVHAVLGDLTKKHHVAEVIHYVQYATLIDRSDINHDVIRINLRNGIYNRETKQLEPHTPAFISIVQIPIDYNPDAKCVKFDEFIHDVMHTDDIKIMYEFFGYCLVPDTKIERAVMLYGKQGANGKSKMLGVLTSFLGKTNTSSESLKMLEHDQFSIAELYGKLANVFPDIPSTTIYDNSVFKMLTGDEVLLRAVRKFEHSFQYKNTARLIFSANTPPSVPGNDPAYHRRWIMLEFPNHFEGEDCDEDILRKLTTDEELSGILNIALCRLDDLLQKGDFSYDKTVEETTRIYKMNSDPIYVFSDEEVLYSDEDCRKPFVYNKYTKWCRENHLHVEHENVFSKRFIKLGFISGRETTGERKPVWCNCSFRKLEQSVIGSGLSSDVTQPLTVDEEIDNPSERQGGNDIVVYEGNSFKDNQENVKINSPITYNVAKTPSALTDLKNQTEGARLCDVRGQTAPPDALTDLKLLRSDLENFIRSNHYTIKEEILHEFCRKYQGYDRKNVAEIVRHLNVSSVLEYGQSHSQRDKIKLVKDIINQLSEYNEIIKQAKTLGLDVETVDSIIIKLQRTGQVINPSEHVYRLV